MKLKRLILPALLAVPAICPAASREIVELQRDVAQLQQQLKDLQQSQNEKLTALTVMVQQALDASTKANTALAVLDSGIRNTLKDQERAVVVPVAGVGTKVDQMTTDFQALRESVNDLTNRLGKMQQQMIDVGNAVRTMQAPAPPPPGPGASASMPGGAPAVPAEVLYQNAMRDRLGGKVDLALQEFSDYLKYYGDTEMAPNAQFYIADIHLSQGDTDTALKEFDMVLEKYPDNNKTPDALYMKGVTLVKMGKRTQGAQEFRELIKRFPADDLANKARSQLKALGLSTGTTTSTSRSRSKKR